MQESQVRAPRESATVAIANGIVRITHDYTGRGPTKARTHIHDNLVTVLMRDTLTKGERVLAQNGEAELVRAMRRAFQDTMREAMTALVQEVMGRKVITFMSDNHVDPDTAIAAFVLEPTADAA